METVTEPTVAGSSHTNEQRGTLIPQNLRFRTTFAVLLDTPLVHRRQHLVALVYHQVWALPGVRRV